MLRTLSLLAALAPAAALCKGTASLTVSPCDTQLSKTGYQPNPTDPTDLVAPDWNCVADELERDVIVPMQLTVENGFQDENGNFSEEYNRYPYATAVIKENAEFVIYLACSGTSDKSCDQQMGVIDYTDVYINDAGTYQGGKPKTEVVKEESTSNAVRIRINTLITIVEGVGDYTSATSKIGTVYGKAANFPDANQAFYRTLVDNGLRTWPDFSSVARSIDANVVGDLDVCVQVLEAEAAGIAPLSFLVPQPSSPPSPSPSPLPSPPPSPPPSPSGPPSEEGEEGDEGEGNGGSDHDDDHDDDGDNDDGDNDDDDDLPR